MANPKHVAALRADVDQWNQTRSQDSRLRPDLTGADLHAANLVMADLRYADLCGANLVGARLIGVDLEGANLTGADLRTAEDLTTEQLEHTNGDSQTRIPDDLLRPSRWAGITRK
jgi:uncharacterized protein YjbI with pentapeptide repeats